MENKQTKNETGRFKMENYQTKRENKLIGLEIEFFGVNYRTVVAELTHAGIAVSYEGYTHRVIRNAWKLVTDVSVNGNNTGLGKGLELVSPPLPMAEMERQLKIVSDTFKRIGAKVDKTCGIHVHHEIDDLNVQNIKNLYTLYAKHNETLDEIMPKSRRRGANRFCKGLDASMVEQIQNADSIQKIQEITWDRYYTLNFTSYVKYGTVEFRQHSGSTEYEKIMNWIKITQAMVHTAATKKRIKPTLGQSQNRTVAFNKEVGVYHTVQGVYVRDRKAELRKLYKVAAV